MLIATWVGMGSKRCLVHFLWAGHMFWFQGTLSVNGLRVSEAGMEDKAAFWVGVQARCAF